MRVKKKKRGDFFEEDGDELIFEEAGGLLSVLFDLDDKRKEGM